MRPVPGMVWIISIHAPTRGATGYAPEEIKQIIFQSTLPQGERLIDPARTPRAYKISIHAPTRGATIYNRRSRLETVISIHAPTRGATISNRAYVSRNSISIHAPTRGATKCHFPSSKSSLFQSTLPQGERLPIRFPLVAI